MIQGKDQFDFWYETLKLCGGFESYTQYQLLKLAFVAGVGSIKEEPIDVSFCKANDIEDILSPLYFLDDKFDERNKDVVGFSPPKPGKIQSDNIIGETKKDSV